MNDLSDRTRADVTYHTRPVIYEQWEHQKLQSSIRENMSRSSRAKMEEQEMNYLRQLTSLSVIESPER